MTRYVFLCTAVPAAMIAVLGCNSEDPDVFIGPADSAGISEAALIGTWTRTYSWGEKDTIVFNADGSCDFISEFRGETNSASGTWSVSGSVLSTTVTESGVYEGEAYKETTTQSLTSAIVDGMLYKGTMNRTSGSGDSLDGKWTMTDIELEEEESYSEQLEETYTLTVTGNSFELVATEKEIETEGSESETDDSTKSLTGTVEVEGNVVRLLSEESLSDDESLPSSESTDSQSETPAALGEVFSGYRIASGVLLPYIETAEDAASDGYIKVN